METKALPPAKISPAKLLPGSNIAAITKKISVESIGGGSIGGGIYVSKPELAIVKKQVLKIKDLITSSTLLKQAEEEKKRKLLEQKESKDRENKLEKPKEDGNEKIKLPAAPKLSFLDRIKKFLFNVLLGYVVVRLIPHIPKLMGVVDMAGKALDFVTDWGGKLLNGMVSFVDWGYKAYEGTRKFLGNLGGENFTKVFDTFNGVIGKVIETAITTAIVLGSQGDDGVLDIGGELIGDWLKKRGAQQAATSAAQQGLGGGTTATASAGGGVGQAAGVGAAGAAAIVAGAGLLASALGEGAFQLKKMSVGMEQGAKKAYDSEKNPLMKPIRWLMYQSTKFVSFQLGTVGSLLDIVGTPFRYAIELIRYPFLDENGKKKQALNLAKFDARIREQFREGLNAVSFGLIGGGGKGSWGSLFGEKGTKGMGYAGGGVTRGGKFSGGVKREVKKSKVTREVSVTPTKLKPGADIGGEDKIEKIFPKSDKENTVNPLGYIEDTYDTNSKIPFFGPIFSIATKTLVGDKPSSVDYKNAGAGLNSWMGNTFNSGVMGAGAFAGGGEVNAEMFMNGEDLTNVIAKSLEESISSKVDTAINDLMKQLGLKSDFKKDPSLEGKDQPTGEGDILQGTTPGEYGPILDLIASVEAAGGYDVVNGGKISGLSGMTISAARQAALKSGGSGAMGRYQQMPDYVLGRARSIGLNPDTDLFNSENQDKLAILLIDGAGYKNWKSGKVSTEQFANRLSATWRGLPEGPSNKTYQDQYASGNKAHTSWANVIATLNAAKSGKIAGGQFGGGILGSGKVGAVDQFNSVAKQFGLQVTSSYRRGDPGYHGKNRARDYSNDGVGNGTPQQLKFAQHLVQNYGSSLEQLIYTPLGFGIANGKKVGLDYWGASTNSRHYDHVHVALAKGGMVDGVTYAMLGERGREFVIDADSTAALEDNFPGFLGAVNKANYEGALQVLRNYAYYEYGAGQEVVVEESEPEIVYLPMPMPQQSVVGSSGGSGSDSSYDSSYKNG